jgi:hypothetical protein
VGTRWLCAHRAGCGESKDGWTGVTWGLRRPGETWRDFISPARVVGQAQGRRPRGGRTGEPAFERRRSGRGSNKDFCSPRTGGTRMRRYKLPRCPPRGTSLAARSGTGTFRRTPGACAQAPHCVLHGDIGLAPLLRLLRGPEEAVNSLVKAARLSPAGE